LMIFAPDQATRLWTNGICVKKFGGRWRAKKSKPTPLA
jgi:hypothetical protein